MARGSPKCSEANQNLNQRSLNEPKGKLERTLLHQQPGFHRTVVCSTARGSLSVWQISHQVAKRIKEYPEAHSRRKLALECHILQRKLSSVCLDRTFCVWSFEQSRSPSNSLVLNLVSRNVGTRGPVRCMSVSSCTADFQKESVPDENCAILCTLIASCSDG